MINNEDIDFAIDWFESALERDKDHNKEICLDCKANELALYGLALLKRSNTDMIQTIFKEADRSPIKELESFCLIFDSTNTLFSETVNFLQKGE